MLIDYAPFIIAAFIFVFPVRAKLEELSAKRQSTKVIYSVFYTVVITGLFFVALSFVVSGQNNPFLYMGF